MIKLYGLRMSNYYSLVKAVLIEKGLDFEEIKAPPTQKEDNLARSPMGKMPSIEVDGQYMSESLAIITYLEQMSDNSPLIPTDPFQAGKVMELVCHIKLDAELVARRCLAAAAFGGEVSDETREATDKDLERGLIAVNHLMVCDPYAAGGNGKKRKSFFLNHSECRSFASKSRSSESSGFTRQIRLGQMYGLRIVDSERRDSRLVGET